MNFFTHYRNIKKDIEKRKLRNKIINGCKIQHSTFYSWISRKKIPALAQNKISEIMNKSISELFPETENNTNLKTL